MSAFWPLALFFVFSSLAFGCMEGWSIATCEVILFLGAAIVGWNSREFWSVPKRLWLPALLVVVLIVIGLIQMVPLPASWWAAAGSERYTRYTEGAEAERLLHTDDYRRDPFGPDADKPLPPENWAPLTPPVPKWIPATFTPSATGRALLALAAGLCLILLLERLAEEGRDALRKLAWLVGSLGLLVSLLVLVQSQEETRTTILWLRESQWAPQAFGPFVNPNHGGAFINLTAPVLCFLLWRRSLHTNRPANAVGIRMLCVAILALHAGILAISHSGGALLPLVLAPAAFLLYLAARNYSPGPSWWNGAALAFGSVLAASLIFSAATGLVTDHGRLQLAQNLPLRNWVIGQGLGSFTERFPAEQTDLPMITAIQNTHLENEFGQSFFEGGGLAIALSALTALYLLYLGWRCCRTGTEAVWFAPPIVGEVVHTAGDFTAHVFPVVGAYLILTLLAIVDLESCRGLAAAEPSQRIPPPRKPTVGQHTWLGIRQGVVLFILAIMAIAAALKNSPTSAANSLLPQGALTPILRAEQAVAEGQCQEALLQFRVALIRARRAGAEEVFTRIRWGMISAGKRAWSASLSEAWPLCAEPRLLSKDFSNEATQTERWLLENGWTSPRFEYPLVSCGGNRTVWGGRPTKVPLWLYRELGSLPGKLGLTYADYVDEAPANASYLWAWDLDLITTSTDHPILFEVEPSSPCDATWFGSINFIVPWSNPATPVGNVYKSYITRNNAWRLDRVVAAGTGRRRPLFSAFVVREYAPL